MGIKKLNTITTNMTKYKGTFKTIIIDALNMFHVYISGVAKKLLNNQDYSSQSLINQLNFIVSECSQQIFIYFMSLKKYLSKDGIIYIVFDPIHNPIYELQNGEIYDLKTEERSKRKATQTKADKSEQIKDILDLKYGLDTNILEIEEWINILKEIKKEFILDKEINNITVETLFVQQYFFSQIGKQLLLLELIIYLAIQKFNSKYPDINIQCLFSESEADFVIKFIAYMSNSQPVLVCSTDTDYLVLLSDLPNVYKTQLTKISSSGIFYPYELWRTQFTDKITQEQIYALATIAGNDYTIHESILDFDIEKYKALMNVNDTFYKLDRSKKIKQYISFYPTGITKKDELISIIQPEQFKKSYNVYKSWNINCKIMDKKIDYDRIINELVEHISKYFKIIYNFDVYTNCPYNISKINLTSEYLKQMFKNSIVEQDIEFYSDQKILIQED